MITPVERPAAEAAVLDPPAVSVERPILLDLMTVGVYVNSVMDLVRTSAPFRRAEPVLRHHLATGDYPEAVRQALVQALAPADVRDRERRSA